MLEKMQVQEKQGRNYVTINESTDAERIYKDLARSLLAKKIHKCSWITRIEDRTNYDGTRTVTVYQDNGIRMVYTIED